MVLVRQRIRVRASGVRKDGVTPERHDGVVVIEGANEREIKAKLAWIVRTTFPGMRIRTTVIEDLRSPLPLRRRVVSSKPPEDHRVS